MIAYTKTIELTLYLSSMPADGNNDQIARRIKCTQPTHPQAADRVSPASPIVVQETGRRNSRIAERPDHLIAYRASPEHKEPATGGQRT